MTELPTSLPEVRLFVLDVHQDARGAFLETFRRSRYAALGIGMDFVQDNLSRSAAGVLRGLHYQLHSPQAKLVQVLRGLVYDVVVDIRIGSPRFGRWFGVALSGENHHQLYVPPGFAHGFCVRSAEGADVLYKVSSEYAPEDEHAVAWDDPSLAIPWGVAAPVLSPRDATARPLAAMVPYLPCYEDVAG